jgi:hypothetical protein
MNNPVFKPRKAMIHVPDYGVVSKEDFNQDHAKALFKRQEAAGVDRNAFIKQHLEVVGFGDMPLFEGDEPKNKKTSKKLTKEQQEEAELQAEIDAEELSKK